eukprot:Blabericola_migrator_1__6590@NODE_3321_length_1861_cov_6_722965_g2077_i0_p2_GENE_NODE_3321_length_1861_cov_6_722965_g2077_i0NODE_3321_length_1861_cov_6_722965_g2077_i0_p2_ORF_typecomplete_len165_score2_37Integrase_H2C2/PF17921_1/3_8e09zfH2C2/PF09337_10/0_024zfH2C2/PF09337_10/4_5e03rve/PF00665_26/0_19_NODE_3321_length_1861_cov_6_722965_g2077_i05561050
MIASMTTKYWWPGMTVDIINFCQNCAACQKSKNSTLKPGGLLQPIEPPHYPWQEVSMDLLKLTSLVGPGGQTYDSVFVVIDRLTRRVRLIPARETARIKEHNGWRNSLVGFANCWAYGSVQPQLDTHNPTDCVKERIGVSVKSVGGNCPELQHPKGHEMLSVRT